MTVAELKQALKKEGKAVSGKKAELIRRLRAANAAGSSDSVGAAAASKYGSKENNSPTLAASAALPHATPPSRSKIGRNRRVPLSSNSGGTVSGSGSGTSNGSTDRNTTPKRPTDLPRASNPSSRLKRQNSAPSIMTASARKRRRKSMAMAVAEMEKLNDVLKKK